METDCWISIVVTNFNYSSFLGRCIESCLSQDLKSDQFEIVVVDDASTDSSREVLSGFGADPQVQVVLRDQNGGVAAAANDGIRRATGEFVTRVDADDAVVPSFARKLAQRLRTAPAAFCVCCDYRTVDPAGATLGTFSARTHPISCGVMYRRNRLMEAGLYDPLWRHLEEEELRGRLGYQYSIEYVDEVLYDYLRHDRNKTLDTSALASYRKRLETGS